MLAPFLSKAWESLLVPGLIRRNCHRVGSLPLSFLSHGTHVVCYESLIPLLNSYIFVYYYSVRIHIISWRILILYAAPWRIAGLINPLILRFESFGTYVPRYVHAS
jgi:hypothetical protein